MAIPLEWKASIYGAEDVKAKLAEIREEYQKGDIGIQEYTQKQTFLTRQLRQTNLSLGTQKSIFLATHPTLNKLSQGISIFTSVSRSALTIMNALNLAILTQQGASQQVTDANLELLEARKELRLLDEAGLGPGDAAYDEAIAKVNELTNALMNLKKSEEAQRFDNLVTQMFSFVLAVGIGIQTIIKLLPFLDKLKYLSLGSTAALGSAGLAGAFIAVAIAGYTFGKWIGDTFLPSLEEISYWWYVAGEPAFANFADFFITSLPQAIAAGVNFVISAMEKMVNAAINILNRLIRAINKIPGVKIPLISQISLPKVDLGSSTASGGSSKAVPFSGSQFAGSAGGVLVMNIAGSILSERELKDLTGAALKERLKRAGYG